MLNRTLLSSQLKNLRLIGMKAEWEHLGQRAVEERWTYGQFLSALCNVELAGKESRRKERNLIESKLPVAKTLDTFNFSGLGSVTEAQIASFAEDTQWIEHAKNLIIFGPSGVGKTHLAAGIGRRLIERGKRVFFAKTTVIVQNLQQAFKEQRLSQLIEKLGRFDLLILDDIGYVRKSESETSALFELIADRYETKSLLITSNQSFEHWNDIFPTEIMAVAAIDRLIHHAKFINIQEKSYRRQNSSMNAQIFPAEK